MNRIYLSAICMALAAAVSCGGNSNKGVKVSVNDSAEQSTEVAATQASETLAEPEMAKQEVKVTSGKWYEQDFFLKEKMYVSTASMTRIYARKGNVLIFKAEGSMTTNLFVCTDSTRTGYVVNDSALTYIKKSEKSDFSSVDEAMYDYLHSSMSNTVFGEVLKKGGDGVTSRDTTLFGRQAYILTQEKTEDVVGVEMYSKLIQWVDKENGLPYYKYGFSTKDGAVIIDGKAFEILEFSADPSYDGLITSLDGLTEK